MGCKVGQWVQIHQIILPAGERAPQVPDDTQKVPLEMWCKGFALNEAELGEEVTIETVIGEKITGTLWALNPRYSHDFGEPVPELLSIGVELRAILKEVKEGEQA